MRSRCFSGFRLANHRRRGLTLMELVVVMVILVALAGIIVPLLPSMIERAHRSSQATNTSEVTKAIQLYQSLNGTYPDGYDLLSDGATVINYLPAVTGTSPMPMGDTPGAISNYLGFQNAVGGYVTAGALTLNALNALNGAGIANEYALTSGTAALGAGGEPWQPTFNPYPSTAPPTTLKLTTGTQVVYVNGSGVLQAGLASPAIINTGSTTQFVLFGLGKYCSAVGTVMANAPSNFPNDTVHENPNQVYERFGLIFQVEDVHGNGLPSALFLGAVAIESNILLSTDKIEESYTQNIQQVPAPNAGPGE